MAIGGCGLQHWYKAVRSSAATGSYIFLWLMSTAVMVIYHVWQWPVLQPIMLPCSRFCVGCLLIYCVCVVSLRSVLGGLYYPGSQNFKL